MAGAYANLTSGVVNASSTSAVNASPAAVTADDTGVAIKPSLAEGPPDTKAPVDKAEVPGIDAIIEGPVNAKSSFVERIAAHVVSTVGSSLVSVDTFGTPNVEANLEPPTDAPASARDAKAVPTVDDPSTVNAAGGRAMAVTDTQATDALAAEALDATDGAFPTVDDAIEVGLDSVTPSGFDSYVPTANSTGRKPGFQTASKAPLSMHIQALATTKRFAVSPSGIDSNASSTVDSTVKGAGSASSVGGQGAQVVMETRFGASNASSTGAVDIQTCGKPGFQTLPEAPLGTHMQASTVSPSAVGSAIQPDAPALESGPRPSTVSTPRREPHPFLTTENAKAYTQDPRMEGLSIANQNWCT